MSSAELTHQATVARTERLPVLMEDIEAAARAISGQIKHTPTTVSKTLSKIAGATLALKFENLQFTAAFKERGALNKLLALTEEERKNGVIAMSAGNHAQGVAYHAARLGIPATIVMPEGTPMVKVEHTAAHGARVIVHGEKLEDAAKRAHEIAAEEALYFLHPFDDPVVIAGQGTIAIEMLADQPEIDTLVIPIGGGGLISGMAIAAKAINPDIRIVGVQSALFPSMHAAVEGYEPEFGIDSLAEGIAVKYPGKLTQEIVGAVVDDIILVDEVALEHAVSMLVNVEKTVAEGAGAAGLAAVLSHPEKFHGRHIGLVVCGGNIDPRLLAAILLRDLMREGRLVRLRIRIRDLPGQLVKVAQTIANAGGNIMDIEHHRIFTDLPAKGTYVDIEVETRDRDHLNALTAEVAAAGFRVQILHAADQTLPPK
ncbi:MAG: threonine ammonia-lyase [Pseudomonadota bacterium]